MVRSFLLEGFTLYELLVVIIIVALVAAIALPNFTGLKERSLGKAAKAQLKLIIRAERDRYMENGTFYPSDSSTVTDINAINSNLSIILTGSDWNYSVTGTQGNVTAYADRIGTGGYLDCQYSLVYNVTNTSNAVEPTANSACPK